MTDVPFTQCCRMLTVDAKTLRQWLKHSNLALQAHPTDARVKCLTIEQIHLLAHLHGRVLQAPLEGLDPGDAIALESGKTESHMSPTTPADADFPEKLAQLEAQVASMQTQIAQLALQLLQERQQRTEQRLLTLEALLPSNGEHPLQLPVLSASHQPETLEFPCHPTEKRTSRAPLISFAADGSYVLICPKEGELSLTPDSQEWFAWLASLSSFRFVGQAGRFSARRGYNRRPTRGWYAQRTIHQQFHSKYIGVSENVTIDRLEHIAAHFQSYMN